MTMMGLVEEYLSGEVFVPLHHLGEDTTFENLKKKNP